MRSRSRSRHHRRRNHRRRRRSPSYSSGSTSSSAASTVRSRYRRGRRTSTSSYSRDRSYESDRNYDYSRRRRRQRSRERSYSGRRDIPERSSTGHKSRSRTPFSPKSRKDSNALIPNDTPTKEVNDKNEQVRSNENSKNTLDENTLKLLGEVVKITERGPGIHNELSTIWSGILKNGLDSEIKENLLKKYPVPENCDHLQAPETNPAIKSIMLQFNDKKDNFKIGRQQQLGHGIAAIGEVLTFLVNAKNVENFTDFRDMAIEKLGDAARILTDLFHELSLRRRACIVPALNPTAKKVAESSNIDLFLFGKDYSEKLSAAKNAEKEGKDLMKDPGNFKKSTRFESRYDSRYNNEQKSTGNFNNRHLNSRFPHKKQFKSKPYHLGGSQKQRGYGNQRSHQRDRNHRR